jgi:hypothetical protein
MHEHWKTIVQKEQFPIIAVLFQVHNHTNEIYRMNREVIYMMDSKYFAQENINIRKKEKLNTWKFLLYILSASLQLQPWSKESFLHDHDTKSPTTVSKNSTTLYDSIINTANHCKGKR